MKKLMHNSIYTISSNAVSLFVSFITLLLLPKFCSIGNYGYWQLYLLYCSYVVFLSLGWCDGIYLKYGGKKISEIDKEEVSSFFWLSSFTIIVSAIVYFLVFVSIISDVNKRIIISFSAIYVVLFVPRTFISYLFQATNNFKKYSIILMIDRITYSILLIVIIILKIDNLYIIILIDIISKLLSLVIALLFFRNYLSLDFATVFFDIKNKLLVAFSGLKLMFANFANSLILGIQKMFIEMNMGIIVFGKISLAFSLSNIISSFINAVGLVIYPSFKNSSDDELKNRYKLIYTYINLFVFIVFIFYKPVSLIIVRWLPNYSDSITVLSTVLLVSYVELKSSVLANTYMKIYRREGTLFTINLIMLLFSVLGGFCITKLNLDIKYIVLFILFIVVLKFKILSYSLNKTNQIKDKKSDTLSIFFIVLFSVTNLCFDNLFGYLVFVLLDLLLVFQCKEAVILIINKLKFKI